MWLCFSHIQWFPYFFFLTFDGSIVTLGNINILFDRVFLTFSDTLIFTHIWQFHRHIGIWAAPTSYVTIFLSHLIVPLFFFLAFDGSIITLSSTNITYNSTFTTFGCTRIFFKHLMVPSSNYAIPKSYVNVLLSCLVVRFFFSHKWWFHCHIRQYQHYIWP